MTKRRSRTAGWLGWVWVAACCASLADGRAAEPDGAELLLRGRYAEAIAQFEPRAQDDPAAAIGLARCYRATGKLAESRRSLMQAVAHNEDSAALHAELALWGLDAGEHGLAAEESAAALAIDPNALPARWVAAELLRLSGKMNEAEQAYGWFVDRQRQLAGKTPEIDAESLRWIGLAAAQHARWTRNQRMFHSLVNDLYPAALKQNAAYWPAHLEMARLFHEKYNEADALAAVAAGLALNPQAADLHAVRAELAVRQFDVVAAQASLERALAINPRHVEARQLEADVHMINTEPAKAVETLETALEHRPTDERTLGRLLGCYAALDGGDAERPSERMQSLIAKALERNPHCGELFLAAGDSLDRMRRFEQAAGFYREAHERMPRLTAARSQLGMTLMRLGDEPAAAKILEEAFAIDPFHVRVKNTLEVLDLLQGYAVIETAHFVLKFDRGQDELLARYAARYLEDEVYPQLVKTLGYEPRDKTLIEIFSRAKNTSGHGWFSARMAGVPAVGTIGACAGKMVAITSPRELKKKYNWAKVLRHEFVHVVNLQQTGFNVPHWLTEGIAVHLEDQARPAEWNSLLVRRAKAGKLFTLDNILFGFVRPQQRDDWTLAYCQAELYVDYARQTHGEEAIARLLAAYGARLSTAEAIEKALGVTQAEFEKGYRQFVDELVKRLAPDDSADEVDFAQLAARAEAEPKNAEAAAALAAAYLKRDDKRAARKWADAAVKLDPSNPIAAYVLAQLQLSIGGRNDALKLLEDALDRADPHEPSLALLASLRLRAGDLEGAETLFQLGRETFTGADRWTKGLASIYLRSGSAEKLQPVLVELADFEPDNLNVRKKLSYLALERKAFDDARRWATQCLHLDVEDAETHALLGRVAVGQEEFAAAAEEYSVAVQLDGDKPAWRLAHGETLVRLGKRDEARRVLEALREKQPGYEGLEKLLESIKP